jgi:hypothetical protein
MDDGLSQAGAIVKNDVDNTGVTLSGSCENADAKA